MQKRKNLAGELLFSVGLLYFVTPFSVNAAPLTFGNYTISAEHVIGGIHYDSLLDPYKPIAYGDGVFFWYDQIDSSEGDYLINRVRNGAWGYGKDSVNPASPVNDAMFGAHASGERIFSSRSSISYNSTYTNTGGEAQNFTFNFGVDESMLAINGDGTAFAELLLRIRVNGEDVTSSRTTLVQDGSGLKTCANTALGLLSSYIDCSYVHENGLWAPGHNYTLDLGSFAAGESFVLDYEIMAFVYGDLSKHDPNGSFICTVWEDPTDVGDPGECLSGFYDDGGPGAEWGGAVASSGDPSNSYWTAGGMNGSFGPLRTVPEPSIFALLGLAFAGLSIAGRRRKRQ